MFVWPLLLLFFFYSLSFSLTRNPLTIAPFSFRDGNKRRGETKQKQQKRAKHCRGQTLSEGRRKNKMAPSSRLDFFLISSSSSSSSMALYVATGCRFCFCSRICSCFLFLLLLLFCFVVQFFVVYDFALLVLLLLLLLPLLLCVIYSCLSLTIWALFPISATVRALVLVLLPSPLAEMIAPQ